MPRVAIAFGSNLGDREACIRAAAAALAPLVQDLHLSSMHETSPVDVAPQPLFLNAAAVGDTTVPLRQLLDALLEIEREFGRERPHAGAARTLDLDLILYGDEIASEPGLVVPHPRFRRRRFVLEPLAEVASDMRDPVTGRTIEDLLRVLEG